MEILARRLTIITLLLAVFAISLAAAVESDARRHAKAGPMTITACAGSHFCNARL
ncbi:hypothetical protein LXM94_22430 [Rhizobium sp. TRM95111]|uniref:hypothetical protein n=1 Tax=Rhizobium alarense TaxID=2846851 RepID=UPI001F32AFAC|nr:hypothetical protein [Rhizobium alarense]MCF3642730.1 hypothetical protein [Rhizobium alarense]